MEEVLNYEVNAAGLSGSPKEIIKASYVCFNFIEEEIWLKMLKDRND